MASTSNSGKKRKKYTRYTRAHLRGRNIRFWLCYLALIVLIVIGLMTAYNYFSGRLEEYEESYYTHVAEDVFNEYFLSEDSYAKLLLYEAKLSSEVQTTQAETIDSDEADASEADDLNSDALEPEITDNAAIDYSDYLVNVDGSISAKNGLEGKEEYIEYLKNAVGEGEIAYTEIAPKKSNEKRFLVTVSDKAFAEFTLKRKFKQVDGVETDEYDDYTFYIIPMTHSYPWGHEVYEFDTIYIDSVNPLQYDYYVPSYAEIYVNGHRLDDSFLAGDTEAFFFEGHIPNDVNGFNLVHYVFDYAFGEPEVSVISPETNQEIVLNDLGDGVYRFEYIYDDDTLKEQFESIAMNYLKQWCLYSSHNTNKASVTDLCIKGSRAISYINNYESIWITKADKQSFENERSWNYTMIDGKVLCCDVACNYVTVTKNKTNDYAMHLRLYLYKDGGSWKVYDFEMISGGDEA